MVSVGFGVFYGQQNYSSLVQLYSTQQSSARHKIWCCKHFLNIKLTNHWVAVQSFAEETVRCWYKREVYFKRLHPQWDLPPLPLSLSAQCCQSNRCSFLCLRLMSDTESSTLKWPCTCSPFPKVKMRNRFRIPIAVDQMNGGDFERLISLSQSVWSWRRLQRPKETTMASEILQLSPWLQRKQAHMHTHILLYFDYFKRIFLFSTRVVLCQSSFLRNFIQLQFPSILRREFDV